MHIGICDDEENIRLLLKRYVLEASAVDEVYLFRDSIEVKTHLGAGGLMDILFLDIDLNDRQDGMSLAGEIKEKAIAEGAGGMTLMASVLRPK